MDPLFNTGFWQYTVWDNSVFDYLAAVLVFVGVVYVLKWSQWLILASLMRVTEKTKTELDDALIAVVKTVKPPFYTFIAFYAALRYLDTGGIAGMVVNTVLLAWLVYQAVVALQIFIEFYVKRRMKRADDRRSQSVIQLVHSLLSVVLWVLAALFVLSNLGINVTSLVAGLGIGGIAVALAAQNILSDLFSSLVIYFDKPFVPGDFVDRGDYKGTVQTVGIKTTRLKSVSGEEIVVPNREMTAAALKNFGRMKERRVVFVLGVKHETSSTQMEKIPLMIREIIEGQKKAKFSRAHFNEFGAAALRWEVVYQMTTGEYRAYMDTQEQILLGIKRKFKEEGIEIV